MEFHAWCNPYRVKQALSDSLSSDHIVHKHPDWVIEYGNKWYLDPANPDVRKYVTIVVADIVSRYDIDAIQFDDYFYPYKITGQEFPDKNQLKQNGKHRTIYSSKSNLPEVKPILADVLITAANIFRRND